MTQILMYDYSLDSRIIFHLGVNVKIITEGVNCNLFQSSVSENKSIDIFFLNTQIL